MFDLLFSGIGALLAFFYSLVPSYAIAIALLTLTIYLAVTPLLLKQTRSMLAQVRLQPEIKRLKKEHQGDNQALWAAQQELFKKEGVNPAAACLPMLVQIPVMIVLYQVLLGLTNRTDGRPNPKYLDKGSDLYQDIVEGGGRLFSFGIDFANQAIGAKPPHDNFLEALPFFILVGIAALSTWAQLKTSQGRSIKSPDAPELPGANVLMKVYPLMTLVINPFLPAGVGLYIIVSNLFRFGQQEAMYRWDPHVKRHAKEAAESVKTRVIDTEARASAKKEAKRALSEPVVRPSKPSAQNGSPNGKQNGSAPASALSHSGRAQPKGTPSNRRRRRKNRR